MPSASSAFVHYSCSVLDILDRRTPQTPLGMRRTYSETRIPPLVYGITPEGSSDEKGKTKSQTTLGGGDVPISLENSTMTLPIMISGDSFVVTKEPLTQFIQTIQGDTVVTVPAVSLVTDRVKTVDTQKSIDPDFYLPHGLRLSDTQQYKRTDLSPEGNLAVIVKLPSLKDKYGVDLFLLDRKSGHLYVPNQNGIYSIIEEKGWIYPTESRMTDPVAGNLSVSGKVTSQTLHLTGINPTPDAESTRDSIRHGPKRPPKMVRELLNEKRRNTPRAGSSYQSFNQTPTIREMMADKTKLTGLTLETSPVLQKYLDHEHQLHLQMIEEQKQLEDLRKQKIQDQLEEEERRRKLEEQEIA